MLRMTKGSDGVLRCGQNGTVLSLCVERVKCSPTHRIKILISKHEILNKIELPKYKIDYACYEILNVCALDLFRI